MSFIKRITKPFRKKEAPQDDWESFLVVSRGNGPTQVIEENVVSTANTSVDLPDWIKDESSIRDEGVIFGLTDAKVEDKLNIIRNSYKQLGSEYEKTVVLLSEKIGVLNLQIEQIEQTKNEEFAKKEFHLNYQYQSHQLPRYTTAILLSLGALVGAFFIIDFGIKQKIVDQHWFVSIGVYFAGLFSVYQSDSILERQTKHSFWKIVEWYFVPFAAASFVFICALETSGWLVALGLFLFTGGIFTIVGRLLFSHIHVWSMEWRKWKENSINSQFLDKKVISVNDKIAAHDEGINTIRAEKWAIVPELTEAETQLSKINSERDAKVQLFMSEYELAVSVKDKISMQTIKNIIS
ncbi:hypothetical protein SAMN06298216_0918 [Spirosomataceae bacterium TFI 002]|nr:hypothetical protein SAMN06298216_0918 [Spirosomataceae bacterium TFI 002]